MHTTPTAPCTCFHHFSFDDGAEGEWRGLNRVTLPLHFMLTLKGWVHITTLAFTFFAFILLPPLLEQWNFSEWFHESVALRGEGRETGTVFC